MMKKLILFLAIVCAARAADIIPASGRYDWQAWVNVGVVGGIPTTRTNIRNVLSSDSPGGLYRVANNNNTTTGNITSGTNSLTVANATGFAVKNSITIGVTFPAVISAVAGNVLTLDRTMPSGGTGLAVAHDECNGLTDWINNAAANDIIYLPAGNYAVYAAPLGLKAGTTLRGQLGAGPTYAKLTTIFLTGPGVGDVGIIGGNDTEYPWNYNSLGTALSGTLTQGTATITVGSSSGFNVGDVATLTELNDWANIKMLTTGQSAAGAGGVEQQRMVGQKVTITSVPNGTSLGISPALLFTYSSSLLPRIVNQTTASGLGVEDLLINCSGFSGSTGLQILQSKASWVQNVDLIPAPNIGINLRDCFQCEVRHCRVGPKGGTPSVESVLFERNGGCLFEDNIFEGIVEVNFYSTSNVFAYNVVAPVDTGTFVGKGIDANHGAHNCFNLYEGNIGTNFQSDGYYGSASDDTVARNWFHGYSATAQEYAYSINLNRFSRRYNVVSNVLGIASILPYTNAPQYSSVGSPPSSYTDRVILVYGYPNIGGYGNNGGTAKPSIASWWPAWRGQIIQKDTAYAPGVAYTSTAAQISIAGYGGLFYNAINNAKNGLTTWGTPGASADWSQGGTDGFQEIDLDVLASSLIKGNYNYATSSIPAAESLAGSTVASSYYRTSKPAYFGPLTWPAFAPENGTPSPSFLLTPAGYRYINGFDPVITTATPRFPLFQRQSRGYMPR